MKPGKPLTFAEIVHGPTDNMTSKKVLAFGLPGNPVSALVCFNLFVIPAIRCLSGWANPHLPRLLKILILFGYFSFAFLFFIFYFIIACFSHVSFSSFLQTRHCLNHNILILLPILPEYMLVLSSQ